MEREQQWMRSAVGLAVASADEARAPHLMRQLCQDCAELLRLTETGVMLADLADAGAAGPGPECLCGDRALINIDLRQQQRRWPDFTARALADGHTVVTLLPLHGSDDHPRAVLQLLSHERQLSAPEIESAQRLGDLAVALQTQCDELQRQRATAGQLSQALDSRVVIEQAKGMLAEQLRTDTEEAFAVLRGHARATRTKLADVARAVVDRRLSLGERPAP
ncbi:ANTAR domain-containing protein [Streptomyces sp. NBC_00344]|uniref:ANTAR domain-containing protein n=1 Tax=Streptomyces sp. NBC_00344 TaxID=2975720 RepID=UPI002E203222